MVYTHYFCYPPKNEKSRKMSQNGYAEPKVESAAHAAE